MARILQHTFFKKHAAFIWLMLVGLTLRILFIEYQGLSNDELSAWFRTRYVDWNSFWNLAVKTGDMHPVFYQAFLHFWVQIFGDSEFALRSTGLLFYILNSALVYTICNRFFSKNTGLAVIALYSCLTFTIINTTLARPYNSGTFFVLILFLSILEINRTTKKITGWHFGIIIGLVGAMTSHYFAFLTAGLIGVLGLIYLQKNKKKDLLIGGIAAIILFLPHWPVTQYQLSVGGLGWLPAPELNWLVDFTHLFFNNSWGIATICLLTFLILINKTNTKLKTREEKFVIYIFIITYISAHLISLFYTPILRELVMLYLLPFLLIFLFRRFELVSLKKINFLVFVFPLILGSISIFYSGLLKPVTFGVFKEIGEEINGIDKNIRLKDCTTASNYNNVGYINYYLNIPIKESIQDWSKPDLVYQLADRAKNSKLNYFLYTWSNSPHIPMYYEVIQKYFPTTTEQVSYLGSAYRLYSKKGNRKLTEQKNIFKTNQPIQTSDEFFGEVKIDITSILSKIQPNQYILLKTKGKLYSNSTLHFVATIERNGEIAMKNENPILYQAYDQSKLAKKGEKTDFFIAFDLPEDLLPTDVLKIYFWNPEKQKVEIENTRIYFEGGMRTI